MIAVILKSELLRASKDDLVGLCGSSFETAAQSAAPQDDDGDPVRPGILT